MSEKDVIIKNDYETLLELWPIFDEAKDGKEIKLALASVIYTMSVIKNNCFLQNTMMALIQEFKFKNKIK
jgi:hypothetical protein